MTAHRDVRRAAARLRTLLLLAASLVSAPAAAQNILANPHFDTGIGSWSLNDPGSSFAWDARDAASSPSSGSGHLTHNTLLYSVGASQCVGSVTPGALYDLAVKTFIPSGQATSGSGTVLLQWFDAAGCAGSLLGSTGAAGNASFDAWTPTSVSGTPAPAGVASALVTVSVTKSTSPSPFEVFFDDVALQPTGTPVALASFSAE